jgi:hypothetical protein
MRRINASRLVAVSIIAAMLLGAFVGATLLSAATTRVAQAQTEPDTAANGILLPPVDYDPVAARNENLAESVVVPATPTPPVDTADAATATESTVTDAPDAGTAAPDNGNSVTTSLGGSDVTVSSVGGSHEVDRPKKRSERRN